MRHFPIFLDLRNKRVVISGAGEVAVAKLRLLMKTEAHLTVIGENPAPQVQHWAAEGHFTLLDRVITAADVIDATLVYGANQSRKRDAHAAALGRAAGAIVNIVDDLDGSDFITPAIVDRDPVTVAIGTEGAAPVLARSIKSDIEETLPATLGVLARIGHTFRPEAEKLPYGAVRRQFWSDYYNDIGPAALAASGEAGIRPALEKLLSDTLHETAKPGHVSIIGAGPGDPELLTLKARRKLHDADVVIYDRLIAPEILELARREATLIEVGKIPDGPSWKQNDINALMIDHASKGEKIARLKSGDPAIYGRLDEEMDALDAANIIFDIVPGITSAAAAAATVRVSLTQRHRNSDVRIITGHDIDGFAEHDWRTLAAPDAVTAIYMGVKAARFLQGRLMIHGANPDTPVTVIENISRQDQKIIGTKLGEFAQAIATSHITGPAILFIGLAPRDALHKATSLHELQNNAVAAGG